MLVKVEEGWSKVHTRTAAWCAKPKIEPYGLDIVGTSGNPPESDGGDLKDAGESHFEGMGRAEPSMHEDRAIWRAIPKIEPVGLDIVGGQREPHRKRWWGPEGCGREPL